ncbi:inactive polypeptide N-acetylgalactosaminyltransferase-like protein 5 isoform X2 [Macaca fascicularis]|uniref:inactive polypeptide N-acetylgalactosaminyltransferase-like protein 5 isoform X2 n=1 Tax=Macaca fascicularis TaxID=9541 RepID=UPI0032B070C3
MRNAIIRCLFYGSLIFGIWTALLFIYLHHNHVSNWQKKSHEPLSAWSPGKKVHQQIIYGSDQIPKPHVIVKRTDEDKAESTLGMDFNHTNPELHNELLKYGFNVIISRSLGIEREVPDTRNKMCLQKHYPARLPTASIVICFHNEEFHALFRTVSSVMNLTPHYFLEEIILVDDMSEVDDLKEKLDYHLETFRGKIKIIRNKKREGLIRARLIGASHASGDVLVFLDSHCEVNRVWLEPLLHAIAKDPKMVVCPLIDVIDDRTLEYKPSPVVRGAFDWNLQFKWDNVFSYEMDGPEGPTKPIRSPAMSGGIFAIRRHYFNEIGQYDKDMDFWGGENLELSLRIWMCGGQLFIIPCSRVGHISKKQTRKTSAIISATIHNYLRLVHVWLDEYKEQFFLRKPGLKYVTYGNIHERVQLRKRLGCKSFQWYLDNVFPELEASVNRS